MPAPHRSEELVSTPEIEEALIYVAYVVERYGEGYAPILNCLERELAAEQKETPRDRARRILNQYAI